MPREATITYEQVAAAADAILAAGGKPNQRTIREQLGMGSMGTIHRLLQQWANAQPREPEPAVPLPDSLHRAILAYREREVTSATTRLEAALLESQQSAAELATDNERQAAAISDLQKEIGRLHAAVAQGVGRTAQLEADLVQTRADFHQGEARREAAEQALAGCRAEQQAAETVHQKAEAAFKEQIKALETQRSQLDDDKRRLDRELSEARKEAQTAAVQRGKLEGWLEALQKEIDRHQRGSDHGFPKSGWPDSDGCGSSRDKHIYLH